MIITSQSGQSVQKNPRMLSDSGLHLRLNVSPVSLFLNWISWLDRWIPMTFLSREYLIDRTGPSLIESELGGSSWVGCPIFHDNTWKGRSKEDNHFYFNIKDKLKESTSLQLLLPDQMSGKEVTYSYHHNTVLEFQGCCIVEVDAEYKHEREHLSHLNPCEADG